VALGDSWPEGAHCGSCRTFTKLYADSLTANTGHPVRFLDLTGQAQPFFSTLGGGSASLLKALQKDAVTRRDVAAANVLVIATGPNEIDLAVQPLQAGTCGGKDHRECIRRLAALWDHNFDAIMREIENLRAGKPTAIRLVDAANPFLSDPGMNSGLPRDFAKTEGASIFKALNDALCHNAARHDAKCVDVRPILNGRTLDQAVDENSSASMLAVAQALIATGLPELH